MNKIIGVLGGIGPEASAEFYIKLIELVQKRGLIKSNADFPQIVINSIPAPELIYDDISEEELLPYIRGLRELDTFGVDFIVMVCNTIHLFYDRLKKEIKTEIIDLRKEVKNAIKESGIGSVFVLGTPSTIRQGLYRFDDITTMEPDENEMKELSEAIFNFNRGVNKEFQVHMVKEICEKYMKQGAKTVILGCTEFAVMLQNEDLPTINTTDILLEATIRKSFNLS